MEAAEAALRVASAKMATEIIKLLATAGADPREFALVAYGGAGPTHAVLLAEEARLDAVLVPMTPGAFCALGAVLADVRRDYVHTARHLVGGPGVLAAEADGWPHIAAAIERLRAEALDWVAREGALVGEHSLSISANMRYPGQAYELDIPSPRRNALCRCMVRGLPRRALPALRIQQPRERRTGDYCSPRRHRQSAACSTADRSAPARRRSAERAFSGARAQPFEAAVYDRADFGRDAVVHGPAIIEQADTTTLILEGWRAQADAVGTLHLTREARS